MLTKKFDNSNKTLLERYVDLEEKRNKEERWFDEKLDALRDEARQEIKLQTKYQPRSQIIGAKEWSMHTKAPDPSLVYSHFALKYGIPFSSGNHKKTMSELVREINEYEIKKPILFNTDSSKSKLWVDYNPKIRKIDGKELSLLNRVYSALKPVENRLDDSLRLSPSLDRVMMKYGYWEWIEDREILKALKDFNVEIEDDYDDDRGQTTYYMVKDKQ